jgi:hypothetical protein
MRNRWHNNSVTEHLLPGDLERLVAGLCSPGEKRRLLGHLLGRCAECCDTVMRYGGLDEGATVAGDDDYTAAVDRGIDRALLHAAPRQRAISLLAALLAGDRGWIELSTVDLGRLQGLPRIEALIAAGRALRHEDPASMLRFAKLARCAVDRLNMRQYGRKAVADLRALAWAELGSAYRVHDELELASAAMARAVYWCHRGSRSELLLARVADLLASLLAYQRRFPEGRELLALVHKAHAVAGRRHLAGRSLIKQGTFAIWEGHPGKAIPLLYRGFCLLDATRDPELGVQTLWNMLNALAEVGRFRSARRLLWSSRPLLGKVVAAHRMRWLEGRIHAGLGRLGHAEIAFQQTRAAFSERGQVYPAAMVGLELAALWARQGRVPEVYELAEEMIATFRALRIAREAVACLVVLQEACLSGGQLLDVITLAVRLLKDLERQPPRPRQASVSPRRRSGRRTLPVVS